MCLNDCSHYCSTAATPPTRPDLYMPAMPPLQLIARIRRALERRACRRQLHTLLNAQDRQLADLGLCRECILHALRHAGDPCHWLAQTMRSDAGVGVLLAEARQARNERSQNADC